MFQKLKNAVASVFDERVELPPLLPLSSGAPCLSRPFPYSYRVAVQSCHSPHIQPHLVACDALLGLIASLSIGDHIYVTVINTDVNGNAAGVKRCVVPIRHDETWIAAEFIPATGWLLLLSDRLLLIVDVIGAILGSSNDDDISKALYVVPTRITATSLTTFCGSTFAAVGTSDGWVRFVKFCGFPKTSSSGGVLQLQWCENSADVYQYITQDVPGVFRLRVAESSRPREDSIASDTAAAPTRDVCHVRCIEQYPHDPNAFVCVVDGTCGIAKFYALEKRLSAFFVLPPDSAEQTIVASNITQGGGYVIALLRSSLCVWNEQSGKRKDRTTPVHFVVSIPNSAPASAIQSRPNASRMMWIADTQKKNCTSVVFLDPTSKAAVVEAELACDSKLLESLEVHEVGESEIQSLLPWTLTPWRGSWSRQNISVFIACLSPSSSPNVVVLTLERGAKAMPISISSTNAMDIPQHLQCPGVHGEVFLLQGQGANIDDQSALTQHPWTLPLRSSSECQQNRMAIFLEGTLRADFDKWYAFGFNTIPIPLLCCNPMRDKEDVVATVSLGNVETFACAIPMGWNSRWEHCNGCVVLPVASGTFMVVVYAVAAPRTSETESLPSSATVVAALVHAELRLMISCSESEISFLHEQVREPSDGEAPGLVRRAMVLEGGWSRDQQFVSGCNLDHYISVAVQMMDGSFVFQNVFASPESTASASFPFSNRCTPVVIPSILFPATDKVTGFACFPRVQEENAVYVDPCKDSQQQTSLKTDRCNVLLLVAFTEKRNALVINVGSMQVLGHKALMHESWKIDNECSGRSPVSSLECRCAFDGCTCGNDLTMQTIFPYNRFLSLSSPRFPRSFVTRLTLFGVHQWISNSSSDSPCATVRFPFVGGASTLSPLTLTTSLRRSSIGDLSTDDANTAVADDVVAVDWVIQYPCGSGSVASISGSIACLTSLFEDVEDVVVEFAYTTPISSTDNAWTIRIVGEVISSEEITALRDIGNASSTGIQQSTHIQLYGIAIGGCFLDSVKDLSVTCVEIVSQPSGLHVMSFVDALPNPMKKKTTKPRANSDSRQPKDIVCVQIDEKRMILYDVALFSAAVIPAVASPPPTSTTAASPKTKPPTIPTSAMSIVSITDDTDRDASILQWDLWRISVDGNPLSLLGVLVAQRGSESQKATVRLHLLDVCTLKPFSPPQDIRLPYYILERISVRDSNPCGRHVSLHLSVVNIGDDIHVNCFCVTECAVELVHLVLSALPNDAEEILPTETFWPYSRRLTSAGMHSVKRCTPNSDLRCLLGLLPELPSVSSATQKEQGFFKRLTTTSLDVQLEKVDQWFSQIKEESYEDALERMIAPVERRMQVEQGQRSNDDDRRQLLGARYSEARGRGGRHQPQLNETRQQMNENLQLLHERGEKIDKVQTKSQMLADETAQFAELCKKLKEKERSRWF